MWEVPLAVINNMRAKITLKAAGGLKHCMDLPGFRSQSVHTTQRPLTNFINGEVRLQVGAVGRGRRGEGNLNTYTCPTAQAHLTVTTLPV